MSKPTVISFPRTRCDPPLTIDPRTARQSLADARQQVAIMNSEILDLFEQISERQRSRDLYVGLILSLERELCNYGDA